jgi:hypothetical protein
VEKSEGLPAFFVSVTSKGVSFAVSLLFATLAGESISVVVKGLMETVCWRESNDMGWEDFGGVKRTTGRAGMVRGHGRPVPTTSPIIAYRYSESRITCKWFGWCGIAGSSRSRLGEESKAPGAIPAPGAPSWKSELETRNQKREGFTMRPGAWRTASRQGAKFCRRERFSWWNRIGRPAARGRRGSP